MSCAEAFAYSLLLKGADRVEKIVEMLDTEKLAEVKAALDGVKGMAAGEIRQLWRERREVDELSALAHI